MNLTEPQAGSDVGALTTRAEPLGDGRFALTGQKIYITWGEHDLTDNIVHLVLARLPGAPAGSKGVSLFLAPKILPDGARNALRCIGLEAKLGIHASPTCTMAFEGATAWLVGAENRGLAAMFTMMNAARINVGVEGVAVGEAAYQNALGYARDRRQGRAEGATEPGPSPILAHDDIRRMLMQARARTLAGRAICYATGVAADRATHATDEVDRIAAKAREDLLTPIAKAWCTDGGVEVASLGVQVHGGMGFVEGGAAQFYRDARIAPIYEGTNGIQAIDLYGRKLVGDGGAAMRRMIDEALAAAAGAAPAIGGPLAAGAEALSQATDWMLKAPRQDALAGAAAYLDLAARVVGGTLLAHGVERAPEATEQAAVTRFYAATILAAAPGLLGAITAGADTLYDPAIAAFA
jgi:alkylation response protein AidB-like acyl-CoA dehydrogenase